MLELTSTLNSLHRLEPTMVTAVVVMLKATVVVVETVVETRMSTHSVDQKYRQLRKYEATKLKPQKHAPMFSTELVSHARCR